MSSAGVWTPKNSILLPIKLFSFSFWVSKCWNVFAGGKWILKTPKSNSLWLHCAQQTTQDIAESFSSLQLWRCFLLWESTVREDVMNYYGTYSWFIFIQILLINQYKKCPLPCTRLSRLYFATVKFLMLQYNQISNTATQPRSGVGNRYLKSHVRLLGPALVALKLFGGFILNTIWSTGFY